MINRYKQMESKNARANHGAPFSLKSFPIDLAGWKVDSGKQTDTNSIYSKGPWWHSVSQAPSCHPQDRGEPVVIFQGAAKGSCVAMVVSICHLKKWGAKGLWIEFPNQMVAKPYLMMLWIRFWKINLRFLRSTTAKKGVATGFHVQICWNII